MDLMSRLRLGSLLLALLLAGLIASGCSQTNPEPVRIGTVVWPGYEPLYLARELGDLPADEIRLVEYPSATEVIRALRNKSLEAAALTLDEVLVVLADRVPLKVLLVMDVSDGGDVIMARPGIASMQELRGKRIGVESNALGAYMLTRSLQTSGMTIGDVIVKHMGVNTQEQAYLKGDVDAVVTFEPVRTRLRNAGAVELFSSRQLPGEIVDVLVAHEDVYRDRPEVFRKLADTWFKTVDYLREQPGPAAQVIARRLKISPQEVTASYDGLTLPDRTENLRLLGGEQPALRTTVRRLGQVLLDSALLRRPVSGDELLSDTALR